MGSPLPEVRFVPAPTYTVTADGLETTTMHGPGGTRNWAAVVTTVPAVTWLLVITSDRQPRPGQRPGVGDRDLGVVGPVQGHRLRRRGRAGDRAARHPHEDDLLDSRRRRRVH